MENKVQFVAGHEVKIESEGSSSEARRLNLVSYGMRNYKAFHDTGWIDLNKIVVLLGGNSAGKTAVHMPLLYLRNAYYHEVAKENKVSLTELDDSNAKLEDLINHKYLSDGMKISFKFVDEESREESVLEYTYTIADGTERESARVMIGDNDYDIGDRYLFRNIFFLVEKENREYDTFDGICLGMMSELKRVAESLKYMRPQRVVPQREYVFNNSSIEGVDERGNNAYAMLYSLVDNDKFKASEISHWCSEFGYKLEWESVGTNRGQFVLVDKNGIRTNLVDNGFGVGQSLPVLVNLFVSESDRIIIDSPEAFLQTKMQASIADYIIKSSKQNKMIMIETSSEYLLLRIRRRLTEKWIQPCDLSIYFINQAGGNDAKCENIQVDASGRLMTENTDFNNFFSTDFEDMSVINWGGI